MSLPVSERNYPHPEFLAETDWLASRLSDPTVRVVDARPDEDYARGHIPGAIHFSGFSLGGLERPDADMPGPQAFADLAGPLGIDEHTPVIVYGNAAANAFPQMAGFAAWTFLYYGHPDTKLLDGGFEKWTAAGLPLSSDAPAPEPRTFAARPVEDLYCSLEQAKVNLDDDDSVFWDIRTLGEFDGTTKGFQSPARLGHLPGAIHFDYTELFDADDGTLKPADEVSALLRAKGIKPEVGVVTY